MDEMTHQVSIAYELKYKREIIDVLRDKDVPNDQLEILAARVYGQDVCKSACDLHRLIQERKDGVDNAEEPEERYLAYLETRGSRHRDLLVKAYQVYWSRLQGFGPLCDDVARYFKNPIVKKRIINLLGNLPVSSGAITHGKVSPVPDSAMR